MKKRKKLWMNCANRTKAGPLFANIERRRRAKATRTRHFKDGLEYF